MNKILVIDEAVKKLGRFGYPSCLCEVVIRFSEYARAIFSNKKLGVLLIGSAARGELSWMNGSDEVQLFSDIEFLVVVSSKDRNNTTKFHRKILQLESQYDFGKLFHIDYTIITWKKLSRLDRKFFIFESKECGIDLGDRSVRSQLPDVNKSNLNWKELNEVLLHRLSSILHEIPLSLFDSTLSDTENRIFALSLAKNTLDLTTWLHPYEADSLVSGFSARVASWDKNFLERKKLGDYFSTDDVGYIVRCLALRKAPYTPVDAISMLEQTLSLYDKGIAYCKFMNKIDKRKSISEVLPSIILFDEYRFRQRVSQAISLLENIPKVGIYKLLRNTFSVRRGIAANFCQHMLLSASSYARRDGRSQFNLDKARVELSRLTLDNNLEGEDFVKIWLNIREQFKIYQDISHNY